MVSKVSPAVRVRLRHEHLETFLGRDSPLNGPQRQLIVDSISRLPVLLAAPGPNPVLLEWERQIASTFSRSEAAIVFATLGPPEPPEGLPLPAEA